MVIAPGSTEPLTTSRWPSRSTSARTTAVVLAPATGLAAGAAPGAGATFGRPWAQAISIRAAPHSRAKAQRRRRTVSIDGCGMSVPHVLDGIAHDPAVDHLHVVHEADQQAAVAEVVDAQRDAPGVLEEQLGRLAAEDPAAGPGAL